MGALSLLPLHGVVTTTMSPRSYAATLCFSCGGANVNSGKQIRLSRGLILHGTSFAC